MHPIVYTDQTARYPNSALNTHTDIQTDLCGAKLHWTQGTTMDPPSYDEITTRTDGKRTVHCLMIRDELGISRRQHVAALVDKLVPRLRERASMGLSKSPLLILPSDQGMHSHPAQRPRFFRRAT
jgi:hypothetical protein